MSDLPVSSRRLLELVAEHDLDLARLEWAETERQADETTVRLALRHGHETRIGIAVEGWIVGLQSRPVEIRTNHRAANEHREKIRPQTEYIDSIIGGPEYVESGRRLDADVDASIERSAREADAELAEKLAGDPKPELVSCWTSLGGWVPNPA